MVTGVMKKAVRFMPHGTAALVAVLGGIFLGYFACGGFAWHRHLVLALLILLSLLSLVVPVSNKYPIFSRLVFFVTIWLVFFVTKDIASTFYPAPPESWDVFLFRLKIRIAYGPC